MVACTIFCWFRPLRECQDIIRRGFKYGLESGEFRYSCYCRFALGLTMMFSGEPLGELLLNLLQLLEFVEIRKATLSIHILRSIKHNIKILLGEKPVKTADGKFYESIKEDPFTSFHHLTFQSQIFVMFGNYEAAVSCSERAAEYLKYVGALYAKVEHNYYHSLALAALREGASPQDRARYDEQLAKNQDVLRKWSANYPHNFHHKFLLVEAEIARVDGDPKAARLYSLAIKGAKESRLLQDQALACELSMKFWMANDDASIATLRCKEAILAYSKWGAKAKVVSLKENYRSILRSEESTTVTSSSTVTNAMTSSSTSSIFLDIENVIKVSQMISSDIELNKLLFNVMKIIVETAGAQTGALLLQNEDKGGVLSVHAEYLESGSIHVLEDIPLGEWEGPHTVVNYVRDTGQPVVLGRAFEDKYFGSDPFISKHQIKSVMCICVKRQDTFQGVLYMANNLATFAFPQNRVTVLTILTSQLAISLENARLVVRQMDALNAITEEKTRSREAENYRRSLEEFIDTICHEMRNPLNGIYGGVSLLQDQLKAIAVVAKDTEHFANFEKLLIDAFHHLDSIDRCAEQQKVIVDDVLDLSKLESNRIELNPVPFSVRTLVTTLLQMLSPQIFKTSIDVILNVPDDVWAVADVHRLSQIVINLLSNAFKFTTSGFVEISAWMTPIGTSEAELHFSVRDTGIGISDQERSGLFERFAQATRHISSQYGGSGLGLAICKKLVQRMGGEISVESKKWFGSKFSFFIKCEMCSKEQTETANSPSQEVATTGNFLGVNMTILIAEDNAVNQRLLLHYLQQKGLLCDIANNGLEAVEKYATLRFDLILMDIEMPLMNGLEATRKIREMEAQHRRKKVPIVGLSGNARLVQIAQAKEAGMDDYLTKPFHKDDIYRVVAQFAQPLNNDPRGDSPRTRIPQPISLSGETSVHRGSSAELLKILKPPSGPIINVPVVRSAKLESFHQNSSLMENLNMVMHAFCCRIPNATSVHVIGDFNQDQLRRDSAGRLQLGDEATWYEMKLIEKDLWKASLPLPLGLHRFSYLVNNGERVVLDPDPRYKQLGSADETFVEVLKPAT
eukprot:TRINITY_DN4034_c0_g2_i1.p1 TRINITY_DN4034_c0_g2~~TRINITY_DN4034_c0_g2_i1.p1  ORF type:complete len:1081 (+),score=277.23 TRINITY_DN4034_c0_g2_i1:3116-6358(+)